MNLTEHMLHVRALRAKVDRILDGLCDLFRPINPGRVKARLFADWKLRENLVKLSSQLNRALVELDEAETMAQRLSKEEARKP